MAVIPDAQTAAVADPAAIEVVIQPLGFQRFRARGIISMSSDYLRPWSRPSELRFVGKYASDAYWIFCRCGPQTCMLMRWLCTTSLKNPGMYLIA